MALCSCPSVTSRSSIETAEQIELILAWGLLSPILHCFKEVLEPRKTRVLHSGTVPKLRTWKMSPRQVDSVVNQTR